VLGTGGRKSYGNGVVTVHGSKQKNDDLLIFCHGVRIRSAMVLYLLCHYLSTKRGSCLPFISLSRRLGLVASTVGIVHELI
jgi:hypothetical protein